MQLASLLLLALTAGSPAPMSASSEAGPEAGWALRRALEWYQEQGVDLLFSDRLVSEAVRLERAPTGATFVDRLGSILEPVGLRLERGAGEQWIVVRTDRWTASGTVLDRRTREPVAARLRIPQLQIDRSSSDGSFELESSQPGRYTVRVDAEGYPPALRELRFRTPTSGRQAVIEIDRPVVPIEEIVVTPSQVEISRTEPVTSLSFDETARRTTPVPGGDLLRTTATSAGVANADFSAELNVRGGWADEVQLILDGIEIYEPFHLKDLENAVTLVPPRAVESLELRTGGFSAAYGDRMSALLDVRTVTPTRTLRGEIGVSPLDGALTLGRLENDRWSWFGSVRSGLARETFKLAGADERPAFSDLFGKVEVRLGPKQGLRLHALHGDDDFQIERPERFGRSAYGSTHSWLAHEAIFGSKHLVETLLSFGELDEDRDGERLDELAEYLVVDARAFEFWRAEARASHQLSSSASIKWGASTRSLDVGYDYALDLRLEGPLAVLRSRPPVLNYRFSREVDARQDSAYVSHRATWTEDLTAEVGLRYSHNRLVGDEHLSPRLHAVYRLGNRTALRASWGHYQQSVRPNELLVEDGETDFTPDELTKQFVLGLDREISPRLLLRIEGYDRLVADPRVRYFNLFDPVALFPETRVDRVRIAPSSSRARGLEGSAVWRSPRLNWRLSYSLAEANDRLDTASGMVEVARPFDQRQALRWNGSWAWSSRWRFSWNGFIRSGWPTTPIEFLGFDPLEPELFDPDLELTVERGALQSDRLPTYHRLDLRIERSQQVRWGELIVSFDLLNALNRSNVRGYEFDFEGAEEAEEGELLRSAVDWGGLIPTFGVELRF